MAHRKKESIALAFGTFDILHPGHVKYLDWAAKYGRLIVIVARDESVKRIKGEYPIMDEKSRLAVVGALRAVNTAVLGNKIKSKEDIYKILNDIRPDVIVLGYDQMADEDRIKKFAASSGFSVRVVRLVPYKNSKFKSSKFRCIAQKRRSGA